MSDDYPIFRRRLQQAEEEASKWRAHALDLVRSVPGAREAARRDLVSAGLMGERRRETCRERRARLEKAQRVWRREEKRRAEGTTSETTEAATSETAESGTTETTTSESEAP